MNLEMVMNELSVRHSAPSITTAKEWMKEFISTITSATGQGVSRVLRTDEYFQNTSLASGYSIMQWWNDGSVDQDERRFFKSLITKTPHLIGLDHLQHEALALEYLYQDKNQPTTALGLGYAHLLDSLAISFPSAKRWNCSELQLEQRLLSDDGIIAEAITVKHCSRPSHLNIHQNWISNRLQESVSDGEDLWSRRNSLFPSLQFCANTSENIRSIYSNDPTLHQLTKRLFELELFCKNWTARGFDPGTIPCKVSPESDATLRQFGQERTVLCPDGEYRLFSWHLRLTPKAWRIHFRADATTRTMIIGYIGRHLSTVNDPT